MATRAGGHVIEMGMQCRVMGEARGAMMMLEGRLVRHAWPMIELSKRPLLIPMIDLSKRPLPTPMIELSSKRPLLIPSVYTCKHILLDMRLLEMRLLGMRLLGARRRSGRRRAGRRARRRGQRQKRARRCTARWSRPRERGWQHSRHRTCRISNGMRPLVTRAEMRPFALLRRMGWRARGSEGSEGVQQRQSSRLRPSRTLLCRGREVRVLTFPERPPRRHRQTRLRATMARPR